MHYFDLDDRDEQLIKAACDAIARNYLDPKHTVGAAVMTSSGKIFTGVNIESCGYGPCAEPVAIGRAITDCERTVERIVAVHGPHTPFKILPPCGNCRQLIHDYFPDCMVIIVHENKPVKTRIKDLLPDAYSLFD